MSGGKSGPSQTTTQSVPPWVDQAGQYIVNQGMNLAQQPFTPYEGQRFAGFNPLQTGAFGTAAMFGDMAPGALTGAFNGMANVANGGAGSGSNFANNALSQLPQFMRGGGQMSGVSGALDLLRGFAGGDTGGSSSASVGISSGGPLDRGRIREVTPGSILDRDISEYMNPFTDNVIDNVQSDMQRMRDGQLNADAARASAAGAFGGSRHGVVDALSNSEFQRSFGQMSDQLRSRAFDNATGLALGDIDRDFQGQQFNAGMDAQTLFNEASNNTQRAIAGAQLANSRANNEQSLRLQALNSLLGGEMNAANLAMSGVNNAISGGLGLGGLNLNAAGALQNFGLGGLNAMLGAGDRIQGQNQQDLDFAFDQFNQQVNHPWANLQRFAGLLGATPHSTTTTSSSRTSSGQAIQQGLGTVLGLAGIFSSATLKHEIEDVDDEFGNLIDGLEVKSWKYKHSDEQHFGPILEDAPEEFKHGQIVVPTNVMAALVVKVQKLSKEVEELKNA